MLSFSPPTPLPFINPIPLSFPYLPLLKWNWIKAGRRKGGIEREKKTFSLGFIEIFIVQGWLAKLNIYADLARLFNLCLGKYVSKVITFYVQV